MVYIYIYMVENLFARDYYIIGYYFTWGLDAYLTTA